jgi:phosphoribosylamine---glycine ligase
MKILIVGSGGREHAICSAFQKSEKVAKIYCANGNAGIGKIATLVNIKPTEIQRLAEFAEKENIDLTFVGGETTLALGIVDEFEKRDLKIIGASKKAAELEASKAFAKDFMKRHLIPTAEYETAFSADEAIEFLNSGKFGDENSPVVIKADGLAAGKGVVVAENRREAIDAIEKMRSGELVDKNAAEKIVIEECLFGREVSLIMFADGENFALMPPTRDHKRIGEGDTGANTGGMGTVSDKNLLSVRQTEKIIEEVIKPTLKGCRNEGFPFSGILFLGLMMTENGAKVLEYNVRFGDPETQAILALLETDFVDICEAINNQSLENLDIKWKDETAACVVIASRGYPSKAQTGDIIHGLEGAEKYENIEVFHAGTSLDENGGFITSGGRVLGVTATAENLDQALKKAYSAVEDISFDGMQYRSDIGK